MASNQSKTASRVPSLQEQAAVLISCAPPAGSITGSTIFQPYGFKLLADSIILKGREDAKAKFELPNGLNVSYAEILYLAGDFYGAADPIGIGENGEGRQARFTAAFNALYDVDRNSAKVEASIKRLHANEEWNRNHTDGKAADNEWENGDSSALEEDSKIGPGKDNCSMLSSLDYAGLSKVNVDHFVPWARDAYDAGHGVAMQTARSGNIELAYAQNAFAEHFLIDSFSSGHMRVPRSQMMDSLFQAICANFMHNEDQSNGLHVVAPNTHNNAIGQPKSNLKSISYKICGGNSFGEDKNKINKLQAIAALQASADEIYDAYQNRNKPSWEPPLSPTAWLYAPTQKSMLDESNPCPMFWLVNGEVHMRKDLHVINPGNPPKIETGKWEFESVVQYKVVLPMFQWVISPNTFNRLMPQSSKTWLCWANLAYAIAPTGYHRDIVVTWIKQDAKEVLGDWLHGRLAAVWKKL